MAKITKSWHCVYDLHYHIVFPVKYRKSLLSNAITSFIKTTAEEIHERYEIVFEQIGCDNNHIHLLLSAHSKYAPGSLVRVFKSITARELFKKFPEVKRELWGGQFWSDGYYVASVGRGGDWSVVERYIKNQGIPPDQLRLF